MSSVILDIETNPEVFESLSQPEQDYLLKWADTTEDIEAEKDKLSFYPYTAKIVSIALYNPDSHQGRILFEQSGDAVASEEQDNEGFTRFCGTERDIILQLWSLLPLYDRVVTYNGRGFDIPFLMIRSMINRVKPSVNLMGSRYSTQTHADLMDILTFFGLTRKFSLDFVCRRLGIESPKSAEASGDQVRKLYQEGRLMEIAEYNKKDVIATGQLFHLCQEFLYI